MPHEVIQYDSTELGKKALRFIYVFIDSDGTIRSPEKPELLRSSHSDHLSGDRHAVLHIDRNYPLVLAITLARLMSFPNERSTVPMTISSRIDNGIKGRSKLQSWTGAPSSCKLQEQK